MTVTLLGPGTIHQWPNRTKQRGQAKTRWWSSRTPTHTHPPTATHTQWNLCIQKNQRFQHSMIAKNANQIDPFNSRMITCEIGREIKCALISVFDSQWINEIKNRFRWHTMPFWSFVDMRASINVALGLWIAHTLMRWWSIWNGHKCKGNRKKEEEEKDLEHNLRLYTWRREPGHHITPCKLAHSSIRSEKDLIV